jgi:hypothetical protein
MKWMWIVVLVGGCAHEPGPLLATLGENVPYTGIPPYLKSPKPPMQIAAVERVSDVNVVGGTDTTTTTTTVLQPCPIPKDVRLQRVRALLAAVDAQMAALGGRPANEMERLILQSTATELRELLIAWPDILSEADELIQRTGQLGTGLAIEQPQKVQRINQLTDLIRLQLMASQ